MNFNSLLNTINSAHIRLQESAVKAINKHLTIRNWLIGFYIVDLNRMVKTGQSMVKIF